MIEPKPIGAVTGSKVRLSRESHRQLARLKILTGDNFIDSTRKAIDLYYHQTMDEAKGQKEASDESEFL